jgi:HlyD family secretion protein
MADTTIRGSTRGVRFAAVVSLALTVATVTAACGSTAPAPPTSRVEPGQVSTKVSASGALAAVSSQNLGFAKAAQLVEVGVKVGDTVRAGQVLAREDPFAFQQIVNQDAAQLNQQQAILDRLVRSPTVHGDHRSVDQTKKILDANKDLREATRAKDENAVFRARQAKLGRAAVPAGSADVPGLQGQRADGSTDAPAGCRTMQRRHGWHPIGDRQGCGAVRLRWHWRCAPG